MAKEYANVYTGFYKNITTNEWCVTCISEFPPSKEMLETCDYYKIRIPVPEELVAKEAEDAETPEKVTVDTCK